MELLKNAHTLKGTMVCRVALQTVRPSGLNPPRRTYAVQFLCALHLNIFEQFLELWLLKNTNIFY
jgi:hypothetical protein